MKIKKILLFATLTLSMLYYVGWVFYISEPKYIDSCYRVPERYDYVSLYKYKYRYDTHQEVINGIVLQVDSASALIKCHDWRDEFYEIDLKKSEYRIVGKGTIYHKINDYVGFNIMLITQVCIGILMVILCVTTVNLLSEFLS